jgi:hypothetical protein
LESEEDLVERLEDYIINEMLFIPGISKPKKESEDGNDG